MKYLIDTHIFIWSVLDSAKLPYNIKAIIEDYSNEIIVSSITFWEISIKTQLGKFDFGRFDISLLPQIAEEYNFIIDNPTADDYATYHNLPMLHKHRDPFDRMLIHTAIRRNIPILSCDSHFDQYRQFGLKLIS